MAKFDEGHRLEPIIQGLLEEYGWEMTALELEVNLPITPSAIVQGHIDGLSRGHVIEIKSMSDDTYAAFCSTGFANNNKLLGKYKWQISAYMLALRLPCLVVGYRKQTGELFTIEVDEPPYLMYDIANRIAQAENCIAAGTIPDGCTDYPCAYAYLHAPKDKVDVAEDELDAVMATWLVVDKEIKALEKEKTTLREEILERALMGDEGLAKIKGGESGVLVSRYWTEPSEYMVTRKGGWTVKVEGPKNGK